MKPFEEAIREIRADLNERFSYGVEITLSGSADNLAFLNNSAQAVKAAFVLLQFLYEKTEEDVEEAFMSVRNECEKKPPAISDK